MPTITAIATVKPIDIAPKSMHTNITTTATTIAKIIFLYHIIPFIFLT